VVRPTSEKPTELELQFLKILWGRSPPTARDIASALQKPSTHAPRSAVRRTTQKPIAHAIARRGVSARRRGLWRWRLGTITGFAFGVDPAEEDFGGVAFDFGFELDRTGGDS